MGAHEPEASAIPEDPTKLKPFNQEWVQRHRQRQKDKYRSPTTQVARRRSLAVGKIQRAKRPLTKPRTSNKGGKKPVVRVRDIYDGYEFPEKNHGKVMFDGLAREGKKLECLPRLESCKEVTMEDVNDLEKKDKEFDDGCAQIWDQVLGSAKIEDAFAISFASISSQNKPPTFL
jgi:hypothetical protein